MKKILVGVLATLFGVGVLSTAPVQAATAPTTSTMVQTTSPIRPRPVVSPAKPKQVQVTLGTNNKLSTKVDGKAVAPTLATVDYRFTGTRFYAHHICQNDYTGANTPIGTTGDEFESGENTVVFFHRAGNANACNDFASGQEVVYMEYQSADNACGHYSGPAYDAANPYNPYYTMTWAGSVIVRINTYYASCRNTAQRRNNVASRLNGNVAGLDDFYNTTTDAIMNSYFGTTYNYAGPFDRNNLYALMHPA